MKKEFMNKDIENVFDNVLNYLELKSECINKHYESLYDVIKIFNREVMELIQVVGDISNLMVDGKETDLTENEIGEAVIDYYEENLINELADVLLTGARLISEFNLQEPLNEMVEYKYNRQVLREKKRDNNVK